ncbi:MAG: sigma-70 family RNA polymerase sigma factor [Bacteroidota bacterium]
MKDSVVLERLSKGDEKALDYLYKKHYRMMTKIVLSNSGTEQEAMDIYQDALLVLWQKAVRGNLVLTSKISTFLYSICMNLWRKELDRKSKLSNEVKDEEIYQNHDSEEKVRIVRECIEELGDTCRKILTYHYFDGMSMPDIVKKMKFANTDTAKTKKYKCKKRLDNLIRSKYTTGDFFD